MTTVFQINPETYKIFVMGSPESILENTAEFIGFLGIKKPLSTA